ncbi:MAG TPA: sugar phosphate isomerase/epimerase family protein [Bacteroidota bacterium]|nr:sugar phosphate isomerase/epimerase family protein [Bacteroidota bacterium]
MLDKKIICTYLYAITKYGYPPPAKDTLKYIREMKELGFRTIELEGVRESHLLEMFELRNEIREVLLQLDLILPFFCAVLPGLTSPSEEERKKQLRLFEKGCEIARTVGAKGILDNAPLPPYVFPKDIPVVRHYDEDVLSSASFPSYLSWKEFWKYLVDTYREACDIAAGYGLTYQMHPSIGVLSSSADGFLYFQDAVKRENLRFNLDTANQFVMKENLSVALRRLAHCIDYIHLSDNRGIKVEHLKAGEGVINWDTFFETLAAINYKGFIGLDIGGDESGIADLDEAYVSTATWLEKRWIHA